MPGAFPSGALRGGGGERTAGFSLTVGRAGPRGDPGTPGAGSGRPRAGAGARLPTPAVGRAAGVLRAEAEAGLGATPAPGTLPSAPFAARVPPATRARRRAREKPQPDAGSEPTTRPTDASRARSSRAPLGRWAERSPSPAGASVRMAPGRPGERRRPGRGPPRDARAHGGRGGGEPVRGGGGSEGGSAQVLPGRDQSGQKSNGSAGGKESICTFMVSGSTEPCGVAAGQGHGFVSSGMHRGWCGDGCQLPVGMFSWWLMLRSPRPEAAPLINDRD